MPTIMEFSLTSRIPTKCLYHLRNKGLIHEPLTADDQIALKLLQALWSDITTLRSMLGQFTIVRRRLLFESADFETKAERYAYTRYRNLPQGERLSMEELIKDLEFNFGYAPSLDRLRKIRKKAQQRRWREKRGGSYEWAYLKTTD